MPRRARAALTALLITLALPGCAGNQISQVLLVRYKRAP